MNDDLVEIPHPRRGIDVFLNFFHYLFPGGSVGDDAATVEGLLLVPNGRVRYCSPYTPRILGLVIAPGGNGRRVNLPPIVQAPDCTRDAKPSRCALGIRRQ